MSQEDPRDFAQDGKAAQILRPADLPVLMRVSEAIALDENTPALYRGPVPYQGSARFGAQSGLNRTLRKISLRWLLLRELLSVWCLRPFGKGRYSDRASRRIKENI